MNLKACKCRLTKQQYKTLKGQILAGDSDGAMKGLKRLLEKNGRCDALKREFSERMRKDHD